MTANCDKLTHIHANAIRCLALAECDLRHETRADLFTGFNSQLELSLLVFIGDGRHNSYLNLLFDFF